MDIRPLRFAGTYEITLNPKCDDRGYFMRTYDESIFREHGLTTSWVQENQSLSTRRGLIRGLHFQKPPHAETKLIRVAIGAVFDVFVDLRRNSETYGQWDAVELTPEKKNMLYIPKGFAHGFCTLTEEAVVLYKVDAYYAPDSEDGIRWDDRTLNVTWPADEPYLSAKDRALPSIDELLSPF
jgi:dTDP-4-dehydrorhamnose 3,5-epimerase